MDQVNIHMDILHQNVPRGKRMCCCLMVDLLEAYVWYLRGALSFAGAGVQSALRQSHCKEVSSGLNLCVDRKISRADIVIVALPFIRVIGLH